MATRKIKTLTAARKHIDRLNKRIAELQHQLDALAPQEKEEVKAFSKELKRATSRKQIVWVEPGWRKKR